MKRPFQQVDVFTTTPYRGNPVAVVLDGTGLDDEAMARFARWTNLSETTFVLPPRTPDADYRVRIFTPTAELPFAGHPTLGTCHAWLEARPFTDSPEHIDQQHTTQPHTDRERVSRERVPRERVPRERIVQECGAGLVPLLRTTHGLAFAAPPLLRRGPLDERLLAQVGSMLNLPPQDIVAAAWVDNGPGWVAVLLASSEAVLALRPHRVDLPLGAIGPHPPGSDAEFEVRAFLPRGTAVVEDPVTGSLNAALAQWLLHDGRARAPYTASQGTLLGRQGRVHISTDADDTVWVAGGTVTCVRGAVEL